MPTNNNCTQDNLKPSTIHTRQIRDFTTCTKGENTQVVQYCVQFLVIDGARSNKLKVLSNLRLGKTFITFPVGRRFATESLCMKHEMLLSLET